MQERCPGRALPRVGCARPELPRRLGQPGTGALLPRRWHGHQSLQKREHSCGEDGRGQGRALPWAMSRCRRSSLAHREQLWLFNAPGCNRSRVGLGWAQGDRTKLPPFPAGCAGWERERRAPGLEGLNQVLDFCRPDTLWRKATAFEKVFNPPCFLTINRYIEKCYLHPEQLISSIGYFYPPEIGTIICI